MKGLVRQFREARTQESDTVRFFPSVPGSLPPMTRRLQAALQKLYGPAERLGYFAPFDQARKRVLKPGSQAESSALPQDFVFRVTPQELESIRSQL